MIGKEKKESCDFGGEFFFVAFLWIPFSEFSGCLIWGVVNGFYASHEREK